MFHQIKQLFLSNTSEKQIVMKNTFWLTGSEILSRLLRFVLIIYVARILGAEGWGLFSYTLSLIGIAMMISDGGISLFFIKEYTHKKETYLKTMFYLKGFLLVISAILALITGFFFASLPIASLVIPVTIILLSDSLRGFLETFLRAQEKMEKEAVIKFSTNIILVLVSGILITLRATPESLTLGYMIGSLAGTMVAFFMNWKFIGVISRLIKKPENNTFQFSPILKYILPITIAGIATTAILNIDSVMLGIWTDAEQVGLYASAQRILQFTFIIPSFFTAALFPTLSKVYSENQERFTLLAKKSMNFLFLIGTPIAFGGFILATPIMTTFFGNEYSSSGPAFAWLILGIFFIFPNLLLTTLSIVTEKQKRIALHTCITIVIAIILNIILIPQYGIIGAAIGTTIAQISLFIFNGLLFKSIILIERKNLRDLFIATLCMIFSIYWIHNIHIVATIFIGAIVYFGILFLLKNANIQSVMSIVTQKTP